jgi:glutamate carboxypeptidase
VTHPFADELRWIDSQAGRMRELVTEWAGINSGSENLVGLETMATLIAAEAASLGAAARRLPRPHRQRVNGNGLLVEESSGPAIHLSKHPDAPLRVFVGIHFDTVYGSDHSFQKVELLEGNRLRGPGVTDAKGGLVVMLTALAALERSPLAGMIGWEVVLNPDEEIGSPGSAALLADVAGRCDLGLLYEPAMQDGALVSSRKGSGAFTAVVRGRAAHSGRDPHLGRNAIHALADFVAAVAAMDSVSPGVTTNVGIIEGGTAVNTVPDLAIARFNIRVNTADQQKMIEQRLAEQAALINHRDGITLELYGGFHAPPKELDPPTSLLMRHIETCGDELRIPITWRQSGGASDGNRLAAAGLPNIDSLGGRGGAIHSDQEFLLLDSLTERAKLSALLLLKLASGEVEWRRKQRKNDVAQASSL